MKKRIFFLGIFIILLVSGCQKNQGTNDQPPPVPFLTDEERAIALCVQECKNLDQDLSNGPCLSNKIIDDWVCDVAHDPRQDIDNQQENQCPSFGTGAQHFVEVDENCELIKTN